MRAIYAARYLLSCLNPVGIIPVRGSAILSVSYYGKLGGPAVDGFVDWFGRSVRLVDFGKLRRSMVEIGSWVMQQGLYNVLVVVDGKHYRVNATLGISHATAWDAASYPLVEAPDWLQEECRNLP